MSSMNLNDAGYNAENGPAMQKRIIEAVKGFQESRRREWWTIFRPAVRRQLARCV